MPEDIFMHEMKESQLDSLYNLHTEKPLSNLPSHAVLAWIHLSFTSKQYFIEFFTHLHPTDGYLDHSIKTHTHTHKGSDFLLTFFWNYLNLRFFFLQDILQKIKVSLVKVKIKVKNN